METIGTHTADEPAALRKTAHAIELVKAYFTGQRHLRKGICLLNAGLFERATEELSLAAHVAPESRNVSQSLAAVLLGEQYGNETEDAARENLGNGADIAAVIQHSLLQWRTGHAQEAVRTLRTATEEHPDSADLHFELATLLAGLGAIKDAERSYAAAVALRPDHAGSLVGLALCLAAREDVTGAVEHLTRAQKLRPADTKIALLLSIAAKASRDAGHPLCVRFEMPGPETGPSEAAIEQLSRFIEDDTELGEALLAVDLEDMNAAVLELAASALQRATQRSPQRAHLHNLTSQALERLGRPAEATASAERAIELDPRNVRALKHLARLYREMGRLEEAAAQLERSLLLGAEYPDTYCDLGNLYRELGRVEQARWAYNRALAINDQYEAARAALEALAA